MSTVPQIPEELTKMVSFIDSVFDDSSGWYYDEHLNLRKPLGSNGLEIIIETRGEARIQLVKNLGHLGKILDSYVLSDPQSLQRFKQWANTWKYFHYHKPETSRERSIRPNCRI